MRVSSLLTALMSTATALPVNYSLESWLNSSASASEPKCEWPGFTCPLVEPAKCPTRDEVLATPVEQRWSMWDSEGKLGQFCEQGCPLSDCGTAVPCCVVHKPPENCPTRDEVMATPFERRWDRWDVGDPHMQNKCDGACSMFSQDCGTDMPCCVKARDDVACKVGQCCEMDSPVRMCSAEILPPPPPHPCHYTAHAGLNTNAFAVIEKSNADTVREWTNELLKIDSVIVLLPGVGAAGLIVMMTVLYYIAQAEIAIIGTDFAAGAWVAAMSFFESTLFIDGLAYTFGFFCGLDFLLALAAIIQAIVFAHRDNCPHIELLRSQRELLGPDTMFAVWDSHVGKPSECVNYEPEEGIPGEPNRMVPPQPWMLMQVPDEGARWAQWDAVDAEHGIRINFSEDGCPDRAHVSSTPKEIRWSTWDNPDNTDGCALNCKDGNVPCFVNKIRTPRFVHPVVYSCPTYEQVKSTPDFLDKHAVWDQPGCPSDKDGGCWIDECHSDPDVPCCVRPLMLWVPATECPAPIDWDAFMHKVSANALALPA